MPQPKLSVCIICRDEEAQLPRILQSVSSFADEIIFVDTGSVDASIEIAGQFQSQIYLFPWNNHFGEARNEALRHATGEWILTVDCDDEISDVAAGQIRSFINTSEAEGCYVQYENVIDPSQGEVVIRCRINLFRNRPHYRFRDPIHETIDASMAETVDLSSLPISPFLIVHKGYQSPEQVRLKEERNLLLVEKALLLDGENPFLLYSKAVSLLNLCEYEDALKLFLLLKEKWSKADPYHSDVLYKIALCYYETNRCELAEATLNAALCVYPDFSDLHYFMGRVHFVLKRYDQALSAWQHSLQIGEAGPQYVHVQGTGSYLAWQNIAQTLTLQRRYDDAIEAFQQSLLIQPDNPLCTQQLLILLADHVGEPNRYAVMSEVFDLNDAKVLIRLATEAEQARRYELAYSLIVYGDRNQILKEDESERLFRLLCKMG